MLQINKNHVCYIKNIPIFLKRFYNVAKDREICRNCFVQFKNKSEYDDHVTSKVCIYRIPFPTKIVLPPKNSKISFKSLGKTLPPHLICYVNRKKHTTPQQWSYKWRHSSYSWNDVVCICYFKWYHRRYTYI